MRHLDKRSRSARVGVYGCSREGGIDGVLPLDQQGDPLQGPITAKFLKKLEWKGLE